MDSSHFTTIIDLYFPEPQASLMNGILLGIPLKEQPELNDIFRRTGLLHLVVLSGTNISILSAFTVAAMRPFGKHISILITILLLVFFIWIVHPQAPIIRAFIMNTFTFVAIILGRPKYAYYTLFLSGLISTILWPEWVTSLSFHLSYAATLGLLMFGTGTSKPNEKETFRSYIQQELRLSLAAQVFTVPLLFVTFQQLSLVSPLANIATAFMVAPLMVLGYTLLIVYHLHPLLAQILAVPCYGLLSYLISSSQFLGSLPLAFIQF